MCKFRIVQVEYNLMNVFRQFSVENSNAHEHFCLHLQHIVKDSWTWFCIELTLHGKFFNRRPNSALCRVMYDTIFEHRATGIIKF